MAFREFAKMGQKAKEDLVQRLTKLGEDAMRYAFDKGYASVTRSETSRKYKEGDTKAWTDESGDLRDSFASAVYVDGVLRRDTVKYLNSSPKSPHGRKVVDDYLNSIHPNRGKNNATVIVVSAMQYGLYLEQGRHRGGYKIQVVSAATDFINRNYWAYVYDVYKRFEIGKPNARVIRGNINDLTHSEYVPPKK